MAKYRLSNNKISQLAQWWVCGLSTRLARVALRLLLVQLGITCDIKGQYPGSIWRIILLLFFKNFFFFVPFQLLLSHSNLFVLRETKHGNTSSYIEHGRTNVLIRPKALFAENSSPIKMSPSTDLVGMVPCGRVHWIFHAVV